MKVAVLKRIKKNSGIFSRLRDDRGISCASAFCAKN